ncbi:MAG: M48 family metalloprotease, partial [Thermodesulforhabdaceae bacterium]
ARYILITPALIQILDHDEMLAVIAHEMGHVRKFHIPFYLVLFVGYILIVYALSDLVILWLLSRKSLIALVAQPGVLPTTFFSIMSTLPFLLFLILYFRYLFGYFSRNCERQADLYALELLKTPVPLISALRKIAFFSGYREDKSNWHHYGIIERIEFLKDAALNPAIGEAHNKRLSFHIKVWFVAVVVLVVSGILVKKTSWFERATLDTNLKIVAAAVNQSADDPLFYAGYGGYLIEKGSYDYAEKVLLHGLRLFRDNPEILNNLAWLYATAPPPFRKPDKAVELAEQATKLSPRSPHIWDTLAEAYYAKGAYHKALSAINKAIALASPPDDYYLRQKEKIEKKLRE